jgi:hypothetical protein
MILCCIDAITHISFVFSPIIVKRAVAPDLLDDVVQICRSQPFTIMCDESNDHGNDKCFVILIKVFDDDLGSTHTRFLDMPIVNILMILCCIDAITHISFVFSPIKVFQIKHIIIVNFNYTVQLPF